MKQHYQLILFCSLLSLTALMFTSCSDYRGVNEKNPYFQKAQAAQNADDYESAETFYLECLKFSPDSSKAHLQLAIIYEENLKNYPKAIVHYQAFLDAVGQNADVNRMLARVEKLYMAELYRKHSLKSQTPSTPSPSFTPQANVPPPATRLTPTPQVQPGNSPRTYVVKEGDNLSTISINVYGTSKHWSKIYEANRDILPSPEKLKVGQTLKIPEVQ